MATTIANITLSSADIMDNSLAISNSSTLTKADTDTGLILSSNLRTKVVASATRLDLIQREQEDITANKAAKVYIKNMGTSPTKYGTISIGDIGGTHTVLGRLYGGDWLFIPWSAAQGAKESFTYTVDGAWETGDIITFDGVSVTGGSTTEATVASTISAAYFPNWTTTVAGAVVTFTARQAYDQITPLAASFVITDASSGSEATQTISSHVTDGTDANDDIILTMSDATSTTFEYMAIYE